MAHVAEVEEWHQHYVAANMREHDVQEIWAQSMSRPLDAVDYALKTSSHSWAGVHNDEPFALFGVSPVSLIGGVGSPWLLGTDQVANVSKPFLRGCVEFIDAMREVYPTMVNYVDARNEVSIRWLKWLGFDILDAEPYGPFKQPFHKFVMEN